MKHGKTDALITAVPIVAAGVILVATPMLILPSPLDAACGALAVVYTTGVIEGAIRLYMRSE